MHSWNFHVVTAVSQEVTPLGAKLTGHCMLRTHNIEKLVIHSIWGLSVGLPQWYYRYCPPWCTYILSLLSAEVVLSLLSAVVYYRYCLLLCIIVIACRGGIIVIVCRGDESSTECQRLPHVVTTMPREVRALEQHIRFLHRWNLEKTIYLYILAAECLQNNSAQTAIFFYIFCLKPMPLTEFLQIHYKMQRERSLAGSVSL